jgi:hypothetical protein
VVGFVLVRLAFRREDVFIFNAFCKRKYKTFRTFNVICKDNAAINFY